MMMMMMWHPIGSQVACKVVFRPMPSGGECKVRIHLKLRLKPPLSDPPPPPLPAPPPPPQCRHSCLCPTQCDLTVLHVPFCQLSQFLEGFFGFPPGPLGFLRCVSHLLAILDFLFCAQGVRVLDLRGSESVLLTFWGSCCFLLPGFSKVLGFVPGPFGSF